MVINNIQFESILNNIESNQELAVRRVSTSRRHSDVLNKENFHLPLAVRVAEFLKYWSYHPHPNEVMAVFGVGHETARRAISEIEDLLPSRVDYKEIEIRFNYILEGALKNLDIYHAFTYMLVGMKWKPEPPVRMKSPVSKTFSILISRVCSLVAIHTGRRPSQVVMAGVVRSLADYKGMVNVRDVNRSLSLLMKVEMPKVDKYCLFDVCSEVAEAWQHTHGEPASDDVIKKVMLSFYPYLKKTQ